MVVVEESIRIFEINHSIYYQQTNRFLLYSKIKGICQPKQFATASSNDDWSNTWDSIHSTRTFHHHFRFHIRGPHFDNYIIWTMQAGLHYSRGANFKWQIQVSITVIMPIWVTPCVAFENYIALDNRLYNYTLNFTTCHNLLTYAIVSDQRKVIGHTQFYNLLTYVIMSGQHKVMGHTRQKISTTHNCTS